MLLIPVLGSMIEKAKWAFFSQITAPPQFLKLTKEVHSMGLKHLVSRDHLLIEIWLH